MTPVDLSNMTLVTAAVRPALFRRMYNVVERGRTIFVVKSVMLKTAVGSSDWFNLLYTVII